MSTTNGLLTNNNVLILDIDTDPSAGAGLAAPVGSMAQAEDGKVWIKFGAADTAWDYAVTYSQGSNVASGQQLRLALYDSATNSPHVADTVQQNAQNIHVAIAPQAARTAALDYIIPDPGAAITSAQFVLSEGAQTINGAKTFGNDVTVNGNFTVNGTMTYVHSTNTQITDKSLVLNKGGAAGSGAGVGFDIEEAGAEVGYFESSADRKGFALKSPASSELNLDLSLLTANRVLSAPDTAGVIVARAAASPGVAGQLSFWADANNLLSNAALFWDNTNSRLGIGTNAPTANLDALGTVRLRGLSSVGVVHTDVNGNLSTSLVDLTADVTGVLPIAHGGTNSGTALNNNRLMISSGGAIVEHIALTQGSVSFSGVNGLPAQDNANFFWDAPNARLGLGTAAPTRLLDVKGSSQLQGSVRIADSSLTKANYEVMQAQVATADATATVAATIAIPTGGEVMVEARIMALRSGGTAGTAGDAAAFVRTARFKNLAGTATNPGGIQTDYTGKDQSVWDATLAVSGTNAVIRVKGAANNNVDWTVTYVVQIIQ